MTRWATFGQLGSTGSGIVTLAVGLGGIRAFRRWNANRSGPITLANFVGTLGAVLTFPVLCVMGVAMIAAGLSRLLDAGEDGERLVSRLLRPDVRVTRTYILGMTVTTSRA